MRANPITFGETVRVLHAGDFVLREVRYAPHSALPPHEHDRPVLVFVIAGEARGTVDGATTSYAPSSLRSVPAGATHSNAYGVGAPRSLLIEPDGERVRQLGTRAELLERFTHFAPTSMPAVLGSRVYHELRTEDPVAPLAIEGLLLELLAATARWSAPAERGRAPAWLFLVRDQLREEYRSTLSLTMVAKRHGVHPVHVARCFRRRFGCAPSEYVRRLRIDWASEALRRTDAGIATVARDAGYADQSHFTRQFRRATGVTPARYRAAFRE
jgi:AraC family transcriptional regulator